MGKTLLIDQINKAFEEFEDVMLILRIKGRGLSAQRVYKDDNLERKFGDYDDDLKLKSDREVEFVDWQIKGW